MPDNWRDIGLLAWLQRFEETAITEAIQSAKTVTAAAKLLRIRRTTLQEKMNKFGVTRQPKPHKKRTVSDSRGEI